MISELASVELIERIAAIAAILGGFAVVFLLRPVTSKTTALGAGGALSILGIIGLVDSFSPAPGILLVALIGSAWTGATFFLYRGSGNNLRVAVLLSGFALLIVRIIILEISWALIFGYVAVSFAVASSAELTRLDVSATTRRKSKLFRGLVWPFTAIYRAIGSRLKGRRKQLALLGSYLAFELAILIGIPVTAAVLSNGFLAFETVVLIVMVLFSFVVGWFWRGT